MLKSLIQAVDKLISADSGTLSQICQILPDFDGPKTLKNYTHFFYFSDLVLQKNKIRWQKKQINWSKSITCPEFKS